MGNTVQNVAAVAVVLLGSLKLVGTRTKVSLAGVSKAAVHLLTSLQAASDDWLASRELAECCCCAEQQVCPQMMHEWAGRHCWIQQVAGHCDCQELQVHGGYLLVMHPVYQWADTGH